MTNKAEETYKTKDIIDNGLSRRGFIQGVGGAGALLGLAGKSVGENAPKDADGNIIPGFEKIREDPNASKGWKKYPTVRSRWALPDMVSADLEVLSFIKTIPISKSLQPQI
jgi:hypothetical protein